MRVIAGKARRLPLKTVPGLETRPTTDRIKETLFNILQNDLNGIRFLDLFSGSGGIGIEALSRGARKAVFVDNSRAAVSCIKENLTFTKMISDAVIYPYDFMTAFSRMAKEDPFHIVFMDPPYDKELEKRVLEYFSEQKPHFITEDTMIIIEASLDTDFSYVSDLGFEVVREKIYKSNKHVFLRMAEQE